jgi:hypothetical protein
MKNTMANEGIKIRRDFAFCSGTVEAKDQNRI